MENISAYIIRVVLLTDEACSVIVATTEALHVGLKKWYEIYFKLVYPSVYIWLYVKLNRKTD